MPVQVAINGFGRTGRAFLRSAIERDADITVVAINDLADARTLAQLLKFDSSYGRFPAEVSAGDNAIVVDGHEIEVLSLTEAHKLPWGRLGVEVVIESTGHYRTRAAAAQHLQAGASKVIISAPAQGAEPPDATVVLGVNFDEVYDPERPSHHLQRIVHHQLPGAGREGDPGLGRDQARTDDDRALLHRGSDAARRPA